MYIIIIARSPSYYFASDVITMNNVLDYLAAIEKKAIDIIQGLNLDEPDDEEDSQCSPRRTVFANKKLMQAGVSLPNTNDFDFAPGGLEDDGDRPYTVEELQSSLIALK